MKKLFVTGMLLMLSVATANAQSFADVDQVHTHANAIIFVEQQGFVKGYPDGTYRPDQSINRAEFTKILMEAALIDPQGENCFLDVHQEWFAGYVCSAKSRLIIGGYDDGNFKPDQSINVAEASKIVTHAMGLHIQASLLPWYRPFLEALANVHALPLELQSIEDPLTRGQMAEMIYRVKFPTLGKASHTYETITHKLELEPNPTPESTTTNEETTSADMVMSPQKPATYEIFDQDRFEQYSGATPVVLHFVNEWCEDCKTLKFDVMNTIRSYPNGALIIEVDRDLYGELAKTYKVSSPNTIVALDVEGQIKEHYVATKESQVQLTVTNLYAK